MYRIIIAGSRDYMPTDAQVDIAVREWLDGDGDPEYKIDSVICGMAKGADLAGKAWADKRGIYVAEYPADWARWGKLAGKKRNWQMAKEAGADGLIAFWDGMSPGTAHIIAAATCEDLRVLVCANPR